MEDIMSTAGVIYYNGTKNTVYSTTGPTHVGQELIEYIAMWNSVVIDQNLQNFNCILDISPIVDIRHYAPQITPETDYWAHCVETVSVHERGNGKIVVVIDPEKGNSDWFMDIIRPDAVCRSVEDAEHFIEHGDGIDRGPNNVVI
jgi:hypothetical protein